MQRSTPLKRTPFKRSMPAKFVRPERAPVVVSPATRRGVYAPAAAPAAAVEKTEYVRSPALRESYRRLACQWPGCGLADGTVVCAHSNWAVHGKGKGIKASDDRGASLCFSHHSALDQGSEMPEAERKAGWWAAHVATVLALVAMGLWPARIPVPDIEVCPF